MRRSRLVTAVAAAALALAVTGCQQAGEKAAEEAAEQVPGVDDVQIDEDGVTVEGSDGTVSIDQGGDLPDGWPADITLPDSGTIDSSMQVDHSGEQGWNVVMTFDDDVATVTEAFETSLTDSGLTKGSKAETGGMTLLTYASADYDVAVTVSDASGSTGASITVSPK